MKSTRFPHKVIESIQGKPLVQWVYEAALNSDFFSDVIIAIDSKETQNVVESFKGKYEFTSPDCPTGTARTAEVVKRMKNSPEIILNWQADAPLVNRSMLESTFSSFDPEIGVWTLKKAITSNEDVVNPNVVKVVTDHSCRALYFSRAPIPYIRNQSESQPILPYFKHIGLYAFRREALLKIDELPQSDLEQIEMLEQLKFLYHGIKIHVGTTTHESIEIDTKEDAEKVSKYLSSEVFVS